jgi:glutamate racemase
VSEAPVGVFDSGLGGLSVLREMAERLPSENFIYVADSGHCPYGSKPREQIVARAVAITDFLLARGAKLIVVACNTATIAAVEQLRATYPLSFIGIEPAVKPAAARSHSGIVGVLATGAALAGEKLHRLIDRHAGPVRVITQPCPGLVEQVEAGELGSERTRVLVQRYTAPLLDAGADVIVLGCTHYPFLRPLIAGVVGPSVTLLDTGEAVARRVVKVLDEQRLRASRTSPGNIEWFTSGSSEQMRRVGSALWGAPVEGVSL